MTISQYLKSIRNELAAGNATQHTHRSALKSLIESLAEKIAATNEPQRIKCGAPDYIVTRGQVPLGYIEAKAVGVSLDTAEKTEQLARYRESLGNLILTDYLEFCWYVTPRPVRLVRMKEGSGSIASSTSRWCRPKFGTFTLAAIRFARSGSRIAKAANSPTTT